MSHKTFKLMTHQVSSKHLKINFLFYSIQFKCLDRYRFPKNRCSANSWKILLSRLRSIAPKKGTFLFKYHYMCMSFPTNINLTTISKYQKQMNFSFDGIVDLRRFAEVCYFLGNEAQETCGYLWSFVRLMYWTKRITLPESAESLLWNTITFQVTEYNYCVETKVCDMKSHIWNK